MNLAALMAAFWAAATPATFSRDVAPILFHRCSACHRPGGVVKFKLRNVPTKRAYDTLWERSRVAIALTPSGDAEGLRLSPHIYNSLDQIDRAVAAVKSLG